MKYISLFSGIEAAVHALTLALLRLCKRRGIKISPPKRTVERQLPLLEERKPLT